MVERPTLPAFQTRTTQWSRRSRRKRKPYATKLWTFAQWGVIGLVVFLAGLFLGYQLWGQATKLQAQVEDLTDKVQSVIKERDTEASQITLIERDKKELERQMRS